jgi:hypothetical protein
VAGALLSTVGDTMSGVSSGGVVAVAVPGEAAVPEPIGT